MADFSCSEGCVMTMNFPRSSSHSTRGRIAGGRLVESCSLPSRTVIVTNGGRLGVVSSASDPANSAINPPRMAHNLTLLIHPRRCRLPASKTYLESSLTESLGHLGRQTRVRRVLTHQGPTCLLRWTDRQQTHDGSSQESTNDQPNPTTRPHPPRTNSARSRPSARPKV